MAPGDDTITEKAGGEEALGHEELFYETQHTLFLGETFLFCFGCEIQISIAYLVLSLFFFLLLSFPTVAEA